MLKSLMMEKNDVQRERSCGKTPRLEYGLLDLPLEVRLNIYKYYADDLADDFGQPLTVDMQKSTTINRAIIQVEDIDPNWTSLLGVSHQIRHEVGEVFWRYNMFRLRPEAIGHMHVFAGKQIRRIYLELIHPNQRAAPYAFTVAQFFASMPRFLRIPSLEEIDVCIDAPSLRDCIPIGRESYCEEHKKQMNSSNVFQELATGLDENYAGYLYFRLHLSHKAKLRTHRVVIGQYPSLKEKGNNSLNPCDDHSLGCCKRITCRLLHAIEEMCQVRYAHPSMRLHFFEDSISWDQNTSIWSGPELPLVVDLMDLQSELFEETRHLEPAYDSFDVLYLSSTISEGSTDRAEDD